MPKNCKVCLKPLVRPHNRRIYHPGCFKLYRKEYQKKYTKTVRGVRFNVEVLKKEINNIKVDIKKEVLEELKSQLKNE